MKGLIGHKLIKRCYMVGSKWDLDHASDRNSAHEYVLCEAPFSISKMKLKYVKRGNGSLTGIKYVDVRARRVPVLDTYEFEGKELARLQIESMLEFRKWMDGLKSDVKSCKSDESVTLFSGTSFKYYSGRPYFFDCVEDKAHAMSPEEALDLINKMSAYAYSNRVRVVKVKRQSKKSAQSSEYSRMTISADELRRMKTDFMGKVLKGELEYTSESKMMSAFVQYVIASKA